LERVLAIEEDEFVFRLQVLDDVPG
jgi:hypothetical protein